MCWRRLQIMDLLTPGSGNYLKVFHSKQYALVSGKEA